MTDSHATPDPTSSASGAALPLPEGLAQLTPGPLLAELLEAVDVEHVSGFDTVEVMIAWYRQLCRVQGKFLHALLETGLRARFSVLTVDRADSLDDFACEEARAALSWSRTRAERQLVFALDLFSRLPALGEAMLGGVLDEPRARAFIDWTTGLTDDQARQICDQLLPAAARLTVGELIDRIKRLCLAIDPEWAAHRYRDAVSRRTIRGTRNPDGTANLAGYNQPVDRVAAACARIEALARACKRAGDGRPIDQIRSDLYLGMTDGSFAGMTDDDIAAYVRDHPYTPPAAPSQAELDQPASYSSSGATESCQVESASIEQGDAGPDDPSDGGGAGSSDPPGGGGSGPGDAPAGGGASGARADGDEGAASDDRGRTDDPREQVQPRRDQPATSWAVPELRVRLSTLLGQDDYPAEIPGWDYVPGWLARHLVSSMRAAEWRYVLCDSTGHAIDGGLLRSRPLHHGASGSSVTARGQRCSGIVEIATDEAQLAGLSAHVATTGHLNRPTTGGARVIDAEAAWSPVLSELLQPRSDRSGSAADDPVRRTPGARLRRWIQIRDRTCRHPACRVPAATADQDHRRGYAAGGPTTEDNLDPQCRHDHRLTDEAGWIVVSDGPHTVTWISPLGHRHVSRTAQVMPSLPGPSPDPDRRALLGYTCAPPVPPEPCHADCGCQAEAGHSGRSCRCGCGVPILHIDSPAEHDPVRADEGGSVADLERPPPTPPPPF